MSGNLIKKLDNINEKYKKPVNTEIKKLKLKETNTKLMRSWYDKNQDELIIVVKHVFKEFSNEKVSNKPVSNKPVSNKPVSNKPV